jgi:Complex I intermediate-associated protein 30 (CIA30)
MKSSRKYLLESYSSNWWSFFLALLGVFSFSEMNRLGCVAFHRSTAVLVPSVQKNILPYRKSNAAMAIFASSVSSETKKQLIPLLDFRRNETIDMIDRLDDAIMGGISTSTVRQGKNYAIWSGVCRTDGGGFCGFRTNPFRNPLMLNATLSEEMLDGFYVQCRLASDNEADRRVWKLTTRTKPDRGELLYQAPIQLNPGVFQDSVASEYVVPDWQTIYVPFDSFRLVRGPRIIKNGAPLDISKGIYQIGMSMSKFLFAALSDSTEKTLDKFRDGYFELHIQEIGAYATFGTSKVNGDSPSGADQMSTMGMQKGPPLSAYSKFEVTRQRPLLVQLLLLLSKIFFSEQRYANSFLCLSI